MEKLASLAQPSQAEQRRLLRNRVKKSAKRDKKIWWNLKFCQDHRSHPSQQWKSVKQVRSNFAPRPVNIRDIWGYSDPVVVELKFLPNICKPKFGHQKIYRSLPQTLIPSTIGPIQYSELQRALALLKVGKSPGPDELSAELLKYCSIKFQALFLFLFSDCFLGAMVPSSWKISYVVMLLKTRPNRQQH